MGLLQSHCFSAAKVGASMGFGTVRIYDELKPLRRILSRSRFDLSGLAVKAGLDA